MLAPEPFAGEARAAEQIYRFDVADGVPVGEHAPTAETEAVSQEAATAEAAEQGAEESAGCRETSGAWEWIVFSNTDNSPARGRLDVSLSGVTAVAGEAFDFENSRMCRVLCGYTDDGQSVWAKQSETRMG